MTGGNGQSAIVGEILNDPLCLQIFHSGLNRPIRVILVSIESQPRSSLPRPTWGAEFLRYELSEDNPLDDGMSYFAVTLFFPAD